MWIGKSALVVSFGGVGGTLPCTCTVCCEGFLRIVTIRWADPVRYPDSVDQYLQQKWSSWLGTFSLVRSMEPFSSAA